MARQIYGICSNLQIRQNSNENTQTKAIIFCIRENIFSDCTHFFCSFWQRVCYCVFKYPGNEVRLMFASPSCSINMEIDVFGLGIIEWVSPRELHITTPRVSFDGQMVWVSAISAPFICHNACALQVHGMIVCWSLKSIAVLHDWYL